MSKGEKKKRSTAVLNPIQFDAETTGWVDTDKDENVQP